MEIYEGDDRDYARWRSGVGEAAAEEYALAARADLTFEAKPAEVT
jgi:hypothetical protein